MFSEKEIIQNTKQSFDTLKYIFEVKFGDLIDNLSFSLKINRASNSAKLFESGLKFLTSASTDSITTFGLSGSPI